MLLANVAVGIVQLVIAVIFAVPALYIGFVVPGKIPRVLMKRRSSHGKMSRSVLLSLQCFRYCCCCRVLGIRTIRGCQQSARNRHFYP